jgi:hypothetical protein
MCKNWYKKFRDGDFNLKKQLRSESSNLNRTLFERSFNRIIA